MKVYWEYLCDYGHRWTLFRDEDAEEQPEDAVCQIGHEAVVLRKVRPADMVELRLKPAAVIANEKTQKIEWERHYWLTLIDSQNDQELKSSKPYLWREVLALAERFQGLPWSRAEQLWHKLKP